MNRLQQHIHAWSRDETAVLNLLQDHGLISDLCVTAADVPDCDAIVAMRLLIATAQQPSQQKNHSTQ